VEGEVGEDFCREPRRLFPTSLKGGGRSKRRGGGQVLKRTPELRKEATQPQPSPCQRGGEERRCLRASLAFSRSLSRPITASKMDVRAGASGSSCREGDVADGRGRLDQC